MTKRCQRCRERPGDLTVTVDDPVTGPRTSRLCQQCLGPWAAEQSRFLHGRLVLTVVAADDD